MGCVTSTPAETALTDTLLPKCRGAKDFRKCEHLSDLRQLLDHYHKWTNTPKSGIYEYIKNSSHSVKKLVDDHHHLINVHSLEFEDIYNFFTKSRCSLQSCDLLKRNYRDRANNRQNNSRSNSRSKVYHNHTDRREVITQQFLDQIHCHIYHQYDMGFKLTKEDFNQLQMSEHDDSASFTDDTKYNTYKQQQQIGRYIKEKKKQTHNLRKRYLRDFDTNNKFTSNIVRRNRNRCHDDGCDLQHHDTIPIAQLDPTIFKDDMEHIKQFHHTFYRRLQVAMENEEIEDDRDENHPMYSFGVRYYYDESKKDDKTLDVNYNIGDTYEHWYVPLKYKDLQDELLQNECECISPDYYKDLKTRAKYLKKTEHVLSSWRNITLDNIICIMVYCNCDTLQREFTKTYRHQLNEHDADMKKRHREFANLGKILQEAVENNGTSVGHGKTKVFYHGINMELVFTSTLHKFCGPLSTSSDFVVAANFASGNGIIIDLNDGTLLSEQRNAIYFDCQFLSDFASENEKFFIGGAPLKIVSIFDVKSNVYYDNYMKPINTLLSIAQGDLSINRTEDLSEMNLNLIILLKHQLDKSNELPIYVNKLMHKICGGIEFFRTRYANTFNSSKDNKHYDKYKQLAQFLCCDNCHLFNLQLLTSLFPNLHSIAIACSSLTKELFDNILQFLSNNRSNLNNIVFESPTPSSLSFKCIQKKYIVQFQQLKWNIKTRDKALVIEQNHKPKHERKTSTNIKQFQMISAHTEKYLIGASIDAFVSN